MVCFYAHACIRVLIHAYFYLSMYYVSRVNSLVFFFLIHSCLFLKHLLSASLLILCLQRLLLFDAVKKLSSMLPGDSLAALSHALLFSN